ncbi:hypothetical protein BKA65DRAFT_555185 [Rhexocercosporidium sp. MPI-PUGE-AT-0058]|nr:hypothetical protein BKA65DRAFT_555185 [Rhexocercosporidium sp. MPI-PUGE-AT-0058]
MSPFVFFLFIYTLGNFYIIATNLATPTSLTDDNIAKYGIDKVSGFYGPGSWAAWLLTGAACCLSRLLRDESYHHDTSKLDLDLVATFAYPCIAATDAILRLRHISSGTLSNSDLGCIITPMIVSKTGAGIGVVLAIVCIRNWMSDSGGGLSVAFATLSSCFLVLSTVAFDIIIAGTPPRNILAAFLVLPNSMFALADSQDTLFRKLLFASDLLSPAFTGLSDIPFIQSKRLSSTLIVYLGYTFMGASFVLKGNLGRSKTLFLTPFIFLLPILAMHIGLWTFYIFSRFATFYFIYQYWALDHLPLTVASIMDLDQLSTLVIGGVLVFLVNGLSVAPMALAGLKVAGNVAKRMIGLVRH